MLTTVAWVAIDAVDHALRMLKLVDGLLKLLIEHSTVRDHNDRVVDGLIVRVV